MTVQEMINDTGNLTAELILKAWDYVSDKITLQPFLVKLTFRGKDITLVGREIDGYIIRNIFNLIVETRLETNIDDVEDLDDFECSLEMNTIGEPSGSIYYVDNTVSAEEEAVAMCDCSIIPVVGYDPDDLSVNQEIPYDCEMIVACKAYALMFENAQDYHMSSLYDDILVILLNEYNEAVTDTLPAAYKKLAEVTPHAT